MILFPIFQLFFSLSVIFLGYEEKIVTNWMSSLICLKGKKKSCRFKIKALNNLMKIESWKKFFISFLDYRHIMWFKECWNLLTIDELVALGVQWLSFVYWIIIRIITLFTAMLLIFMRKFIDIYFVKNYENQQKKKVSRFMQAI